jgi:hypothetical protein
MGFISKFFSLFIDNNNEEETQTGLSIEKIAEHEAAHGIVWSLFRNNWNVNQLTIERTNLLDKGMDGALHITPNFDTKNEFVSERANEITAIALAGFIGQNMELIKQRDNILFEITQSKEYSKLFDLTGCGGDFEIVRRFSPNLGQVFGVSEWSYVRYKVMDLIILFQNDNKVQAVHKNLSQILLEKKTLQKQELTSFFNSHNFIEYIYEEGLDINFSH